MHTCVCVCLSDVCVCVWVCVWSSLAATDTLLAAILSGHDAAQ